MKSALQYIFLSLLVITIIVPTFSISSYSGERDLYDSNVHNDPSTSSNILNTSVFKMTTSNRLAEENPDAYFPNFLYSSVTTANALIDYLFDSENGGFYRSTGEHWSEANIVQEKRTYDQAQAILALLALSQAVINETQRDYAIEVATVTGNYLISDLYDDILGGFFSSTTDTYKRPGIQGKAIEALLALFKETGNNSYRLKAEETLDFINTHGWDPFYDGYYYKLSHSGNLATPDINELYDPSSKRLDHNALMGSALLDFYSITSDNSLLTKAVTIYDLMNSSCRNNETNLFYGGYINNGEIVDPDSSDILVNSLIVDFLSKLYSITGEMMYFNDSLSLIKAILYNFWDDHYGGFFGSFSYIGDEDLDIKKYTERQFYAISALDNAFKLTDNSLYYNLILDTMEFLSNKLYDQVHEGYIQLCNDDGGPGEADWRNKFAVTQALAISELTNLWLYSKPGVLNAMWIPSIPRPQDPVTIIVAAFDSDGIADVQCNYSLNNEPYQTVSMVEDNQIGNMYNTSFNPHPANTTINFNILVNDTLGNQTIRGSYFFLWQYDVWSPNIEHLGIDPGVEVPVNSKVSITVSSHDVPSQGTVSSVRIYYHAEEGSEDSKPLVRISNHIWEVEFLTGFPKPGSYYYYFEAIDGRGNFGYSAVETFAVIGNLESIPMITVIGGLFLIFFLLPAGFASYKEFEKRGAKKSLKKIKRVRGVKRRRKTRRTKRVEI
jgi:mannose/cellobiose epimerase-like protein (N-acyl-D-glucosamine 2-epimerase family)